MVRVGSALCQLLSCLFDLLTSRRPYWCGLFFSYQAMVITVPEDGLKELVSKLKADIPRTVLVLGTIHNLIRGRTTAKIYTDEWPNFSAIVCQLLSPKLSEDADLLCYSTSHAALVRVLKEGGLITWGKKQKIGIESEAAEFLVNTLPSSQSILLECVFEGVLFYLPGPLKGKQRACPEGYVLGELTPSHTEHVTSHYDYYNDLPYKQLYFDGLIRNYSSVAVFSEEDMNTPVAWAMQHPYGEHAHQYTLKEHRRKGLASLVKQMLCQKMIEDGIMPSYEVDSNDPNLESISQIGGEFVNTRCTYKRIVTVGKT